MRHAARTAHAPIFRANTARARVAHYAALKRRTERSRGTLRGVFQALRKDAVKRAVRRVNAA
eukprot:3536101-Lingulodinium_polyedra.AAC.1